MYSTKLVKRILAFGLIFVILFAMVGCKNENIAPDEENIKQVEVQNQGLNSITIKDHLGRQVTFDEGVERIVSGYYISTSMLIALGLKDKVVGVEANASTRPIYELAAPAFLDLPSVGTAKDFDLEGTLALQPDLVILPIRLQDSINTLEDMGVNVIGINPEDMDLLKETLEFIGKATGTEEKAERLMAYYDEKTQKVREIADANEGNKNRIYFGGNSDVLSTATKRMYQNYMIETAGGENAADIDDTYWAVISHEQLISYNPDILVIAPGAKYSKEDVLEDSKLTSIAAIRDNEVYVMPSTIELWDSPVPSSILGTMWLSSILHPKDYDYEEFIDDVVEFYGEFYNTTIEREMLN
ncbi:MAG: ABC transporter substrate-binding protein [Tissierellaceae bacterium]|nr:ABC transporter substrate-binding protein [Tissierellaceae bacterium]